MNRIAPAQVDVLADQLTRVVEVLALQQHRFDASDEHVAALARRLDAALAPQPVPRDDSTRLDAIERHLGLIASLLAQHLTRSPSDDEVFARLEAEVDARRR